jgi:mRNA-degrading endonuclease toxin of MazEF toxin-antitoxin module
LKPGDVLIGVLVGAQETKVRPAVVIASATYLAERPDAVVGILTTKFPGGRARLITSSTTGNRQDYARRPASEPTF